MKSLDTAPLTNRHPADALSDVREQIANLQARAVKLRVQLRTMPESEREGDELELRSISLPAPSCLRSYMMNGIMACVQQLDGMITAVHCKEIYQKGKTYGLLGRGAVQLASPMHGELGLAEGVETALSATELTGKPCWATCGAPHLHEIDIPSGVQHLYIFADNDDIGHAAADKALDSYRAWDVTIWRPPEQHNDWNDCLKTIKGQSDE